MKKIFALLLILQFISCNNRNHNSQKQAQNILDKVIKQYLPDTRDHIFEISIDKVGDKVIVSGKSDYPKAEKALIDFLKKNNIPYENKIVTLPTDNFKNIRGITRLSVANLRAQPKHSAELVTQTLMGMPLIPLEEENDFIRVKTPENYYAWVDKAGIQLITPNDFTQWLKKTKIIIKSNCGQSYTDSNKKQVVSDIVLNDIFALVQSEKDFYQIQYPDEKIAFIPKSNAILLTDFEKLANEVKGQMIVNKAETLLGTPYLWGGTSSKGMDCSGFTKTVYASFNYNLPRDASQQVKIGKKINLNKSDFSNLQPGDLFFFGFEKNGQTKITHVAIHIGNGKIIHATGEVKIESLNSRDKGFNPDRFKSWKTVRRIIGAYPQNFANFYQTKQNK